MGQLFDPKYGPVVGFDFYVANLDTALTNTDLLHNNDAGETLTPGMPSAGTILGLSLGASAASWAKPLAHTSGTFGWTRPPGCFAARPAPWPP